MHCCCPAGQSVAPQQQQLAPTSYPCLAPTCSIQLSWVKTKSRTALLPTEGALKQESSWLAGCDRTEHPNPPHSHDHPAACCISTHDGVYRRCSPAKKKQGLCSPAHSLADQRGDTWETWQSTAGRPRVLRERVVAAIRHGASAKTPLTRVCSAGGEGCVSVSPTGTKGMWKTKHY